MTGPVMATLANRRVLVAEDEYMIADEIAIVLADVGAEAVGPVSGVADALGLVTATGSRIDAALLDVNLRGETVWPLVDVLLARGVPMLLSTGYDESAIPAAYSSLPCCQKPITGHDLVRALARILAG